MERTEEEKVAQSGRILKIGNRDFEIKPLTIRKALLWRSECSTTIQKILSTPTAFDSVDDFRSALMSSPQQMNDIVMFYLKVAYDLTPDEENAVQDTATEAEIVDACFAIMALGLVPFMRQQLNLKVLLTQQQKNAETLDKLSAEMREKLNAQASEPPSTLQ